MYSYYIYAMSSNTATRRTIIGCVAQTFGVSLVKT